MLDPILFDPSQPSVGAFDGAWRASGALSAVT